MAVPTTREQFKLYCLRKLGFPTIQINVDDDTVEDRIDEALRLFYDFHYDGTDYTYYKYQFTQDDINNQYIQLPQGGVDANNNPLPAIIGVQDIFPITGINEVNNMFDIRYQIALNDLYTLTNASLIPYYQAMQAIALYEQILVGEKPIRYNRVNNRLYIDMSYQDYVCPGDFVIVKCYSQVNPDTSPFIWSEKWLQDYAAALIKKQWGSVLTKYVGVQLVGGLQFNGQQIYSDAVRECEKLEALLRDTYELPLTFLIG